MIRSNYSIRLLAVLLLKLSAISFVIAQQTIRVPGDIFSIQAGIDAASNGDTVLVAPGTYNENIDFKGKSITVTSGAKSFADSQVAATVISGAGNGPVVSFQTNEPNGAVLNGFTIQNGTSTALYLPGTSPTVSNNLITNNVGCAVVITGMTASPLLKGNNISHTSVAVTGTDCNVPVVPFVGFASAGAAISVVSGGKVQIVGNTIEENANQGTDCGAGIFAANVSSLAIGNNIIRNNRSSCNASIFARNISVLSVIQNLIYDNTVGGQGISVSGSGAGLFVQKETQFPTPTTLTMINNTLYGNLIIGAASNPISGGSQTMLSGTFVGTTVENNLFVSTDTVSPLSCIGTTGSVLSLSHNDIVNEGPQVFDSNCVPNDGAAGNLSLDPQFVNPAANNFHTAPTSPVVATGDFEATMIPDADLDARARTVDSTIDMGVYEIRPHPPILLVVSPNPAPGQSTVTLTAGIVGNQATPTGSITFMSAGAKLGHSAPRKRSAAAE